MKKTKMMTKRPLDNSLKDTKVRLYHLLLNVAIEDLTDDETELLARLASDPQVQEIFEPNK